MTANPDSALRQALVAAEKALSSMLDYEKQSAGFMGYADCTCMGHSRSAEIAYETGKCPHQRAPTWTLSGDESKPTLSPSINCGDCGWHGFVQNGEFTNA